MGTTILPPNPPPPSPPAAPPPGAELGGAPVAPTPIDWRKPSFDFLADSTKQLITVATGVVTATVLFSKDLDSDSRTWALAAWVALTFSVLLGISALFNMSGNLHNTAQGKYSAPNVMAFGIRFFSICQIAAFLLGISFVIVFGYYAAHIKSQPDTKTMTINCIAPIPPPPAQTKDPAQNTARTTKKGSTKKRSKERQ
jgi:hypothetical protein